MSGGAVCLQDPRDSQSPLSVPATLPETVSWSLVPHTVPRPLPTDHFDSLYLLNPQPYSTLLNPSARPASARNTCSHSTEDADTSGVVQVVDPGEEVRLTTTLHYRPQSRHQTTHCSSSSCLQLQLSLVRGPGRCSLYRAQRRRTVIAPSTTQSSGSLQTSTAGYWLQTGSAVYAASQALQQEGITFCSQAGEVISSYIERSWRGH